MRSTLFLLNILHILNDGFQASLLLLLPFIAHDLHINLFDVGVLGTGLGLMSLLVAMPATMVSKKQGGLKTLIFLLFFYAIGYIGPALLPYYACILLFFVVASLGFGSFHPIGFALVSKIANPLKRGKLIGDFAAWGDIGRIGMAASITFLIALYGWRPVAVLFGGVAVVAALILLVVTKKEYVASTTVAQKVKQTPFVSVREILQNKLFIFGTLAAAIDSFASDSLFVFLPFLLLAKGVQPTVLGSCTAAFFVGNFFGKTVLGRLVDQWRNSSVFIVAQIGMAIFIALLTLTDSIFIIVLISLVLGALTKGTVPVTVTMLAESLPKDNNFEKAYAVNAMAVAISITLAPVVFGYLSNRFGINYAFYTSAGVALIAVLPVLAFRSIQKELVVKSYKVQSP